MSNIFKLSILLLVVFFVVSCSKDDNSSADCTGLAPTYTNEVSIVLNTNCATSGCHSALFPAAGINLSNYTAAKTASQDGKFLKAVKHQSGATPMPQDAAKLSDANIRLLECWIKNGSPE